MWRNWPILAIGYLGVLLGLGCGLYSVGTALFMCLFPWPFLLMLSFLALCLSVLCRRVLFANIALVGFLLVLFIGHIVAAGGKRLLETTSPGSAGLDRGRPQFQ